MTQLTLEQRVAALERQMARLLANGSSEEPAEDAWQSTLGMFTGDEVMRRIGENARKIREADRKRAGRNKTKTTRAKALQIKK